MRASEGGEIIWTVPFVGWWNLYVLNKLNFLRFISFMHSLRSNILVNFKVHLLVLEEYIYNLEIKIKKRNRTYQNMHKVI